VPVPAVKRRETTVNWKWIGILACVSGLTALLGVFGVLPEGAANYVVSFVLGVGIAFVLARFTSQKFFVNGLMLGFAGGAVATLIQMLFFSTMLENNPQMAARFDQMPAGANPVAMFAIFAPIGIAISGLITGLFTWVIAMLMGKGNRRRTAPPPITPA
jgi:hypothetical protein